MCSLSDYLLVDELDEDREVTVVKIVDVLPNVLPSISISDINNQEELYQLVAQSFNQTVSSTSRASFVNAIDNIQRSYSECNVSEEKPSSVMLSKLFEDFKRATLASRKNATNAQNIFGQFLCIRDYENTKSRRIKRQSTCSCPESVESACHFFACIDAKEMEVLLGFGNADSDEPCIAFVVDTTGSMGPEITATRNVILQFLKAQADSTRCYMLVPFNDHGVGATSKFI